ncbi:MAG: phosphomannomutase/phosphoglucomutase [Myxococcales bacterium]|nr:phosphomannomutase/phosphoglucomutase [Myxococcales bacterium]
MTAHVFREYDIRGVADRDLTDDLVKKIGRGLGKMLRPDPAAKAPPRVVVCRDCRRSGPRLFDALVHGLTEAGSDVVDIGVGPTPLMYFGVHHLEADGGVMITGSHNPGDENGFKIMKAKGSFYGADIQKLREYTETSTEPLGPQGSLETCPIDAAYLETLRKGIRLAKTDMTVVIDAGNGAAGPLGVRALRDAGLAPVALYCDMNGAFPNHHPDPTVPENLEVLIATVREKHARVGIAWDGDGDRMGVVDASGEIVWGDRLLALFARGILAEKKGATVIGEVKCSQSTYDDISKHGGRPIMWKTGHSLIKAKMKQENAALAGEMSGHFFFADRYFGYDDGIYAALRLLEILAREGKTVVELLADLPQGVSTPEIRVECPDALKFDVVAGVIERLRGTGELNEIDGARITYPDGAWGLVRASNTGPVIVVRFEAPTAARLAEVRSTVEAALAASREATESRRG